MHERTKGKGFAHHFRKLCGARDRLEGKSSGIPHLKIEMPRISCTQLQKEGRVRLSLRKGA
jgi:hypothetical protein